MNLHAYFETHPNPAIAAIARRAGTSLAYLQHCKYGNRRMSADLAIRLGVRIQAVHARRRASGRGLKVPLSRREILFRELCYQKLSQLKERGPGCSFEGATSTVSFFSVTV